MRAFEKWLDSDDPHKFASAMMKCQHYGAFCSSDGFCHFNGDCFRSAKSSAREAVNEIRRISTDSPLVRGWLNDAVNFILSESRLDD